MTWTIAFIVLFILGLLAMLFPYRPTVSNASISFATLQSKYQKWETFALVPLFIFLPLMTFLFGQLFSVLFDLTVEKEMDIIYNILPEKFIWYVPAGILSFGLIGFPMTATYKLILGEEKYQEYTLFTNIKHGFDGMKVFRPMAWIFGIVATIGVFLLTDYSIKISDNKIMINRFMSLSSQTYSYNQINSIHFVEMVQDKNGGTSNPHYYVKFADNSAWNTFNGLHDENRQREIIEFLSNKSEIKIDTLQFDPE